jgi:hypothetical protein
MMIIGTASLLNYMISSRSINQSLAEWTTSWLPGFLMGTAQ